MCDSGEAHGNGDKTDSLLTSDCDELENITLESDPSSPQPGFREALEFPEAVRKRCQWLDSLSVAGHANNECSSQGKCSIAPSPKQIYGRLRKQEKKSSRPGYTFTDEELESGSSSVRLTTAPHEVWTTAIPICLPPGCIPSEVMVQLPGKALQSELEARTFTMVDSQSEADPWIMDICDQALADRSQVQPGPFSSPFLSACTEVHDLANEEDLWPRITVRSMSVKKQKVESGRNAICEVLEMNTSFVKINGAKFSLWHLRAKRLDTFKYLKPLSWYCFMSIYKEFLSDHFSISKKLNFKISITCI